jgi:hypothetical protein
MKYILNKALNMDLSCIKIIGNLTLMDIKYVYAYISCLIIFDPFTRPKEAACEEASGRIR